MVGNYKKNYSMDKKEIVRLISTTVDSFIKDRLINKQERIQHKEDCLERLAAEDVSSFGDENKEEVVIRYSDQAVLANLDWGIEALEEAIATSNMETKLARLDYAEKMLHVCAMLNSDQKTAGVPNFYLSAWSHLNLAYLWKLRSNNNVTNCVLHVLEMFIVDPFFSRIDFAPELWKELFLPHMGSIFGWYCEERQRLLVMEVIPNDYSNVSFTIDLEELFNESLIGSLRPDQVEKLKKLEEVFGESLDESTKLYAKYFKDCMKFEDDDDYDDDDNKKMIPMFPIAEPPMTPLHELSHSIPDFVKFGPILPRSAGFAPFLKSKNAIRNSTRGPMIMNETSKVSQNLEESLRWVPKEELPEENEDDYDYEQDEIVNVNVDSNDKTRKFASTSNNKENEQKTKPSKMKTPLYSPTVFSPPKTSPKPDVKSEFPSLLRLKSSRFIDSNIATSPPISNDYSISSESDGEVMEVLSQGSNQKCSQNRSFENLNNQLFKNSSLSDENEASHSCNSLPLSEKSTPTTPRPPKDFVCPITGQIFCDPVTLETGQTYERKAIQEWLKRGNTTCPITRQPLSATTLPKTNYVLKRLINSWKEGLPREFLSPRDTSLASTPRGGGAFDELVNQRNRRFTRAAAATAAAASPTSVISQAEVEKIINGLKPYVMCLCTSENLQECESAVLAISRLWKESKGDLEVHSCLSEPTIVNGFVEILSASLNREVLRISIYILSELISSNENVGEILTSVDSDLDCLASLLKNGLAEAAVLIYQLRPTSSQLSIHELVPSIVQIIINKIEELDDDLQFIMDTKVAAIAILEQILVGGDENNKSINALSVISANGIPSLVKYLSKVEGRRSIVSILLCCMQAEKSCRSFIASRIELCHVLELFHVGNDSVKGICVGFLSELVKLNRRTLSNQVLQTIKDTGAFSSMHTFLVYLQMAPMENQPAIASLLLQLDLLVEPRKMSIYREEAIEVLIEALRRKEFSNSQSMAIDALTSLIGRITSSGDSYIEAWLLQIAGFDQPYNALMKLEHMKNNERDFMETMEEEKAISCWEKRVAFVLCNHEKGSIFKALEECLKSSSLEMAKSCLVIVTWLTYMLSSIPETGVKTIARKALLDEFINVLQSSKNMEEKILATLALKTFISDPDATRALGVYAKSIYKTLRKLKRNSMVVNDIMKALMKLPSVDATELWSCTELVELDSSSNGEVLSLIHLKGRVLSSHSDGTIKVWDVGKRVMRLIQEVREHTKAVTCLYASSSGDKLYSGSLDKTIRVWTVKPEEIHCIQVHDMKEAVHNLTANTKLVCYISQGSGVKVYDWSGTPKHINFNKYVKCLAMIGNKVYCGCSGYNIQEVDLCSYTSNTFYSGTRKLLGKQYIYSLQIHDGVLFAGGSLVDGTAGKIFLLSSKAIIGSFPSGFDIQGISINNDFIFTASKCGNIDIWIKERYTRIASIKMSCGGGHTKFTSLTSDTLGEMLYAASSDGKIQVWDLD
ncbi:putative E3 ubiquitin-protein ligase LIN-1 isoform X1 [Cannabis sativa]|uniref:putative E3 ubiquitin-protein ligase LIN-1 isoform X1 n=1 Tax=Cannabis sativa TaxID=3483 RepID=UPI0029C9F23D|nr:putative E3 ubiquitin-protein ligase LIN-1 isoform X1 [Cannabis sativa]